MSSTKKRKFLTLDERVAVIKQLESGKSLRKVAEQFGVGRTQIQVQYFAKGRVAGVGGGRGRGEEGTLEILGYEKKRKTTLSDGKKIWGGGGGGGEGE